MRSNAFTLTGNTQGTQIASMTAAACQTDWLTIPCASNLGRLPTAMMTCVDRICGGTFNAENQNLNASSVVSKYLSPFHCISSHSCTLIDATSVINSEYDLIRAISRLRCNKG